MNTLETDVEIGADGSLKLLSPLPAWLKPGRAHVLLTMAGTRSRMIPEHSVVSLRRSRPEEGLAAGTVGTVVHLYAEGEDCEVEFATADGKLHLVTLPVADLEVMEPA